MRTWPLRSGMAPLQALRGWSLLQQDRFTHRAAQESAVRLAAACCLRRHADQPRKPHPYPHTHLLAQLLPLVIPRLKQHVVRPHPAAVAHVDGERPLRRLPRQSRCGGSVSSICRLHLCFCGGG